MSKIVYQKTEGLTDQPLSYCPGCTHGVIHKLIGEVLVEMDLLGKAIAVAPVGCSVMSYEYFNCDGIQASHGRAPAVAIGAKRTNPDKVVFTYQGDGDLAAIGTAEIVHAAHRGDNITVIFINNAIYGMTGGQMAPTTLVDMKTATSPTGRQEFKMGKPIRVSEMLAQIPSTTYIERVSTHNIPNIRKAKAAIKKAFQNQIDGKGFSMVELLSTCSIGWNMSPVESLGFVEKTMIPYFPLGIYKDEGEFPAAS
ncbi:MAG: thiamine pyrophosphate-dependent enzyme [Defluviitaleaceae bacterium]|nr:thiamine pyrophosphate-dependent enzyme [Defluviitaleaceae bacterium]